MIRPARLEDLSQLMRLAVQADQGSGISERQLRYLLTRARASTLVFVRDDIVVGLVSMFFSRATSAARIHLLAVEKDTRRQGIGAALVRSAEDEALARSKTSLRAEILGNAEGVRRFFEHLGYRLFRSAVNVYQEKGKTVRMGKSLYSDRGGEEIRVPYYRQTLEFTCGPACLMMAMKALDSGVEFSRQLEVRLWREATTIFMTSGIGGCGPQGLALAAWRRGFDSEIYLNSPENFLIDSVRSEEKKQIMRLVEEDMTEQCRQMEIAIHHQPVSLKILRDLLDEGAIPLVLISSWAIYRQKFPHWLVVIDMDDRFIYAHDPLVEYARGETLTDSLAMPITHGDFQRMARYGKKGQRATVVIRGNDSCKTTSRRVSER